MKSTDLTNQKIEKLTVLYRVEDKVYINNRGYKIIVPQWFCECECGNTCIRTEISLTRGMTKSCGCTKTYNAKDYSGQKFNHLKVLYKKIIEQDGKNITVYRCRCDCGNECDVASTHIKRNKSCGCTERFTDLTNKRFGRLLVKNKAPDKVYASGLAVTAWNCICDCGNKCVVTAHNLTSDKTKSCGCLQATTFFKKAENHYDLDSKPYGICYCVGYKHKFYFDKEDFDLIKKYVWSIDSQGFVFTIIDDKNIFLKNLIMNVPQANKNTTVNFIHPNARQDNRKCNLWICRRNQCQWGSNRKPNKSTGITGVWHNKRTGMYTASLTENGNRHTYYTSDIEKAIAKRKEWEELYFGKYSYDNRNKETN